MHAADAGLKDLITMRFTAPSPAEELRHRSLLFSSRRRHTRYWRDWSSDVCSSDLPLRRRSVAADRPPLAAGGRCAEPTARQHRQEPRPGCDDRGRPAAHRRAHAVVAPARRQRRIFIAAMVLIPAWTVLSLRWGHLDDVLAMVFAIVALRAVSGDRPVLAGAALALAIASKPWAIGFLPLLLVLPWGRLRAALVAAGGVALTWAPFVLANPRTLGALSPPVGLAPASGLHTLGARGVLVPRWGRTAQLVLSPAAATVAVLMRGVPGVLLVSVAVRLALDPKDNAYYIGSAALAAVVFDLLGTGWTIPWTTLATVVLFWQPFVQGFTDIPHALQTTTGLTHWWFAHQEAVGAIHVAWAVVVIILVVGAMTVSPGPRLSE